MRSWAVLASLALFFATVIPGFAEDRKTRVVSMLSSAARTAGSGTSSTYEVSKYIEGQVLVDVTAESGSSTLTVTVMTSDADSTWYTHTTMTAVTETGQYRQAVTNFGKYVRLHYDVAGTSYTFSATGVFKN